MDMADARPNPDVLLARAADENCRAARGKLRIYFGACAGVGKTYAMLEDARKRAAEGVDLLVGYAEPHIRPETESLLLGLELLPYRMVEYKGTTLKEFDLDGALTRRPAIICVDELAHTNAPGMRHAKRYQDVLELLEAGIDVYTTLNVQHLESVNDIVERTSGIKVRETLPDWVFEQADEVQLIDLPPDRLLERIGEGRIYRQHQVEHIAKQFFNKGNLSALRELALRRTADRVDAQMEDFRNREGVQTPWPAADRLLVCIGPSPFSARLVRAARRMASAGKAEWIALFVETPSSTRMPPEVRERTTQALHLAEQLGGKIATVTGAHPAEEILAYARSRNVARIIVGKPARSRWREFFGGSIVDELIRKSGPIDVYVIRDEKVDAERVAMLPAAPQRRWPAYAWTLAVVAAATCLGTFFYHVLGGPDGLYFSDANVLMLDLLGVLLVALRFGRGPALLASALSVLAFDFTVVRPYFTFAVADTQYFLTFGVMFVVALIISTLTNRITQQAELARSQERRTAALLELSRELTATRDETTILHAAVRHVADVFDCAAAVLLVGDDHRLRVASASDPAAEWDAKELGVAQWALEHEQVAGRSTNTLPSARGFYLPLRTSAAHVGVLAVVPTEHSRLVDPERLHLLEAFANHIAAALERVQLADAARMAWERAETELIRNTLLSSVSHDLRTPLAAIAGSVSTLLEARDALDHATRMELLQSIAEETDHMDRFINNLLEMTRLEAGRFTLKCELYPLSELVVSALERLRKRLGDRNVLVTIRPDLPLLSVDGPLFEQVLRNLLENALQYTPPQSPIEISADATDSQITIAVADHGPGLPAENPDHLFQKFYRSATGSTHRGIGLGLAICRQIIELHGGHIEAANRPAAAGAPGGAVFTIRLPNPSGRRSFTMPEE